MTDAYNASNYHFRSGSEIRYFYKGAYRQGWIICRQGCGYNIDVNGLGMQEWFVAGQVHSVLDFLATDEDNEETFERIEG